MDRETEVLVTPGDVRVEEKGILIMDGWIPELHCKLENIPSAIQFTFDWNGSNQLAISRHEDSPSNTVSYTHLRAHETLRHL
eukprot:788642-Ditylum_brightwellii.AAC.1